MRLQLKYLHAHRYFKDVMLLLLLVAYDNKNLYLIVETAAERTDVVIKAKLILIKMHEKLLNRKAHPHVSVSCF